MKITFLNDSNDGKFKKGEQVDIVTGEARRYVEDEKVARADDDPNAEGVKVQRSGVNPAVAQHEAKTAQYDNSKAVDPAGNVIEANEPIVNPDIHADAQADADKRAAAENDKRARDTEASAKVAADNDRGRHVGVPNRAMGPASSERLQPETEARQKAAGKRKV